MKKIRTYLILAMLLISVFPASASTTGKLHSWFPSLNTFGQDSTSTWTDRVLFSTDAAGNIKTRPPVPGEIVPSQPILNGQMPAGFCKGVQQYADIKVNSYGMSNPFSATQTTIYIKGSDGSAWGSGTTTVSSIISFVDVIIPTTIPTSTQDWTPVSVDQYEGSALKDHEVFSLPATFSTSCGESGGVPQPTITYTPTGQPTGTSTPMPAPTGCPGGSISINGQCDQVIPTAPGFDSVLTLAGIMIVSIMVIRKER